MANSTNIKIENIKNEQHAIIKINPKVYPIEAIYSAAYVLLDKAYVILDGDPKKEIIIEITKKDNTKEELKELSNKFNSEILNYSVYISQSKKNEDIRKAIIQRALITNGYQTNDQNENIEDDKEMDEFDDPEAIAIPWEEKYGKDD